MDNIDQFVGSEGLDAEDEDPWITLICMMKSGAFRIWTRRTGACKRHYGAEEEDIDRAVNVGLCNMTRGV
ncbi:unnamed protein product [Bursaphelenchus okinawaensis]|uniref:Uncharacterized protein n=1 Tax=Bursaphelenchus okinawaensis TaxID=465554 RepID=A0A811KPK6_9BILA|nr:unnamed protein product [Bursaphelenchus okinawaensis]CAG9110310.1 unnamed protein product [Bursaphelenchus okinawaensis]